MTSFLNLPLAKRISRIAVLLGPLIPLVILVYDFFTNNLTINPIQAAEQRTGRIAIFLLTMTLACTPIQYLTRIPLFGSLRKPLGLYAFMYALIHFSIFTILDFNLVWSRLEKQLIEKPFIWLGVAALLILTILAATSFKWMMRILGKRWKQIHRLVYLAAVIVVIHYGLALKANIATLQGNVIKPFIYASIILLLLALRIPAVKTRLQKWTRQFTGRSTINIDKGQPPLQKNKMPILGNEQTNSNGQPSS